MLSSGLSTILSTFPFPSPTSQPILSTQSYSTRSRTALSTSTPSTGSSYKKSSRRLDWSITWPSSRPLISVSLWYPLLYLGLPQWSSIDISPRAALPQIQEEGAGQARPMPGELLRGLLEWKDGHHRHRRWSPSDHREPHRLLLIICSY